MSPHIFPIMVTPTMFPWDEKNSRRKKTWGQKSLPRKCVNSFLAHKLSHDRWLCFFWGGADGSLPDAAIWWCLRTGGVGVLTSELLSMGQAVPELVPVLAIQWKMAQAQQIRSIILQNHESTMRIENQKFFEKKCISESNTANNMKLTILEKNRIICTAASVYGMRAILSRA